MKEILTNRVAVFGNAGGGKSTLSKRLAEITGLPMVALDLLKYKSGGGEILYEEYKAAHDRLLQQDQWIIDGYGSLDTIWQRLEVADTLVYIDMPVFRHYWWVTKRFLKGFLVPPENWPENSPLLKSTLNSYYTVWLCHKKLAPKYREYVVKAKESKRVYHLQSPKQVEEFYRVVELEFAKFRSCDRLVGKN
jgi:adenylate kinase family enzyme